MYYLFELKGNNAVYAIHEVFKLNNDQKDLIENLTILKKIQFQDQRDSEILEKQLPNLSPILVNKFERKIN
jgi:hypothetical protein